MNSEIGFVGEFAINDGKSETFKKLLVTAIETVRTNEPDTLKYEFYFDEDESVGFVVELYRNSDAVLTHLKNVGEIAPKLFEVSKLTRADVYGAASDEVKAALAPFGARFFTHWGGFER